jgi:hypothetical protein
MPLLYSEQLQTKSVRSNLVWATDCTSKPLSAVTLDRDELGIVGGGDRVARICSRKAGARMQMATLNRHELSEQGSEHPLTGPTYAKHCAAAVVTGVRCRAALARSVRGAQPPQFDAIPAGVPFLWRWMCWANGSVIADAKEYDNV